MERKETKRSVLQIIGCIS